MTTIRILLTALAAAALALAACSGRAAADSRQSAPAAAAERPAFSADSAMHYLRQQVAFGPRVPGSEAHSRCADYLADRLRAFGADTVVEQRTEVVAFNGDRLPIRNILARFNPQASRRILLLAHWDSRPWADQDPDPARRLLPVDGANDGASGVAVLLELARNLGLDHVQIGVDILLTDAEDYGQDSDEAGADSSLTWALGTQHFADNLPYTPADTPEMAILLDMVGGRDARFTREYFSTRYAPAVTVRVWAEAARLGLADRFPDELGGAVTDDHIFLIRAGIPTVDIIECSNPVTGSFNPTWHTAADTPDAIDPRTLADVGAVVTSVVRRF